MNAVSRGPMNKKFNLWRCLRNLIFGGVRAEALGNLKIKNGIFFGPRLAAFIENSLAISGFFLVFP